MSGEPAGTPPDDGQQDAAPAAEPDSDPPAGVAGEEFATVLETHLASADLPERVALALSGGVDSAACLFALQELGHDVTAYTFTLRGRPSTDFKTARDLCETFDVPFTPVYLPTDLDTLKRDTYYLVADCGLDSKTTIECAWPFLYLTAAADETALVSGLTADGHYVLSKRGMMHFRDSVAKMNAFRRDYFTSDDPAGNQTITRLATARGFESHARPYYSRAMFDLFYDTAWDAINRPNQKQPVYDAYPEQMAAFDTRKHQDLQLGDTGIAEQFEKLVQTDWNRGGYKTPVGIYNAISRGDIPDPR